MSQLASLLVRRRRASAAQAQLAIESVERPDGARIVLRGSSDAGRDARNAPILRLAEARVHIGARSMLVLWAWALQPGERRMPDAARRFLDGAIPAPH